MKITCPYCGNLFEESEAKCPHCEAPNDQRPSGGSSDPVTIEALQQWYSERNLPPYSVTRFFIGEDTREPRAFGIYRNGDKVVVYKNKDNGQRAIRYEGTDEAHAVSEILSKLKEEILHQKEINFTSGSSLNAQTFSGNSVSQSGSSQAQSAQDFSSGGGNNSGCATGIFKAILVMVLLVLLFNFLFGGCSSGPTVGYYNYNGTTYYHQNEGGSDDGWYSYNGNSWVSAPNVPSGLYSDYSDYYTGSSYYNSYSSQGSYYSDFSDSSYYEDSWSPSSSSSSSSSWGSSSSSSSWSSSSSSDNDWDWDSGDSWDSGSSDWDSDW